ncbi:MBL fold metallo-hydrolase [Tepidiforma sp.]|uniref:MBL fold metallo-hydrolase n=1 Tax=Tepidiforma sp. TaxID=2682230 RepID=UPI00260F6630|nr:MBL fold metallo-hydrolase [Tepidiforma sp.]MCX7618976.1 MBL fold metallo-hydrolase [Tepidiforma sp.]
MKTIQFVAEALGDASYLVVSGREAAVIDPQRDIRPFVKAAREHGAEIRYVVETHVHNDYVSGGRELAALGAEVVAPAAGRLEFPHRPVADGDVIAVGDAKLLVTAAPGHTYEHLAYLGVTPSGEVRGAFTGGALLMAAAGRTDLLGPDHTEELTRLQWETAQKLRRLVPASADVLPTHGAGSFCSATGTDLGRCGPMAAELLRNPALASKSYEEFRALHLATEMPIPGYYKYMAPINRKGPKVYGEPPRPRPLSEAVLLGLGGDTWVIDVRRREDYAAGHLPGSLEIEESTSMLAYVGWLIPFDAPIALVTYDRLQAERVTVDLFRIGYEHVVGYAPAAELPLSARTETVSAEEIAEALRSGRVPVLDVRYAQELRDEPVPGARPLPFDVLPEWAKEIDGPVLVSCASGQRAAMAASYLERRGVAARPFIAGGAADVRRALGAAAR